MKQADYKVPGTERGRHQSPVLSLKGRLPSEVEASCREQPRELADLALRVSPGLRAVLGPFLPMHEGRRQGGPIPGPRGWAPALGL